MNEDESIDHRTTEPILRSAEPAGRAWPILESAISASARAGYERFSTAMAGTTKRPPAWDGLRPQHRQAWIDATIAILVRHLR